MAISALAASAFAQGMVGFNNSAATGPVKQWTSSSDSTLIVTPKSGGRVELFAAPKGTALANPLFTVASDGTVAPNYSSLAAFLGANSAWSDNGIAAITSLTAGQFAGGTKTISNIGLAADASYFLIGWNGSFTTLDAALTAGTSFMGQSAIFTTTTGNPLTTPQGTATSLSGSFLGMTLSPVVVVPEPASFALAGLGLAALLVFRRRNS